MIDEDAAIVSVVIPMLDEAGYIEACLDGFAQQDVGTDRLEVLVVDGGSTDGSRRYVDERAQRDTWIRVLDNPARKAAAAFNVGARAATGDIVCIFSSHGVPAASYASSSVAALARTGADGVGGRYLHVGDDARSHALGVAMTSPFGMASPHRFVQHGQEVDTISHPAYLQESLLRVLPFDESLERNSDYELNWRMRELGMRLWFDPAVESIYRPRSSLRALARQFWWYGRWKARVVQQHPRSLRPRHLAAPAAVLVAVACPVLVSRQWSRRVVGLLGSTYLAGVAVATATADEGDARAAKTTLAACFPVMHASWGTGFLVSTIEDLIVRRKRHRER